jgi:predicted amidohydrolase
LLINKTGLKMLIIERCKKTAPAHGKGVRLAIYQPQAGLSGTEAAIERAIKQLENAVEIASSHEAQLISFPELYLTGYAFKEKKSFRSRNCV